MQNIAISREGNTLTLRVDLSKSLGISKSGKSEIIASTSGNVSLEGAPDIKLGINIYRSASRGLSANRGE
jgi:hypothetical protein